MSLFCQVTVCVFRHKGVERQWSYTEAQFLYTIEIKLVLISTTLLHVEMLSIISRSALRK